MLNGIFVIQHLQTEGTRVICEFLLSLSLWISAANRGLHWRRQSWRGRQLCRGRTPILTTTVPFLPPLGLCRADIPLSSCVALVTLEAKCPGGGPGPGSSLGEGQEPYIQTSVRTACSSGKKAIPGLLTEWFAVRTGDREGSTWPPRFTATIVDKMTRVQDICMRLPYLTLAKIRAVRFRNCLLQMKNLSRKRIRDRARKQ